MVARLLIQNALWVIGIGVLLFASAGTLRWPAAWGFLATIAVLGVATSFWLLKIDPALLAERMNVTMQKNQPASDKVFMLVIASLILIWFVVIGLDHRVNGPDSCFDAFSLREPASTSLENALVHASSAL